MQSVCRQDEAHDMVSVFSNMLHYCILIVRQEREWNKESLRVPAMELGTDLSSNVRHP